ncbi:NADPH-dependent FMN reductase [Scrofimicrobium sp. R131]|uniref:NADPH-dependent FMN reductase n=1 Tax=Scrofimicrobium appendicitidis TaxID=3079930 RepID=A0AAU7V882_9ACTO
MAKTVAVLVGSVDPDSLNRRLAKAMMKGAPDSLEFVEVPIAQLPFYMSAYDTAPTPEGQQAREIVSRADGVLLITPEYNRSMPAVLKNAIDWLSRPKGHSAFAGKPVLIAGATGGAIGTAVAQSQARSILPMMGAIVMGTPELYLTLQKGDFATDGTAKTPGTQDFLTSAMADFAAFIARLG